MLIFRKFMVIQNIYAENVFIKPLQGNILFLLSMLPSKLKSAFTYTLKLC